MFIMDQTTTSVIAILIISQIALSESFENGRHQNSSQEFILQKPEAVQTVNITFSSSFLKFNHLPMNQISTDIKTEVMSRRTLKHGKFEILVPKLTLKSMTKERTTNNCTQIRCNLLSSLKRTHIKPQNSFKLQRLTRSRITRNAPCPLSMEMLLEARNQINGAISQASRPSRNCDFSKTSSNYCEDWLNLLKCAANHLKNGIKEASSSRNSTDLINEWETVYKILVYKHEHGETISDSFSHDFKEQFDKLRVDLKTTERIIKDIKQVSEEIKIKMCVENISTGNIKIAIKYFKEIKKNSVLIDIIRASYHDHGELQNLKNIIDFGNALSTCGQSTIVYVTLYDLIKDNNQLNSPHTMMFYKGINHCMKNTSIETSLAKINQEILSSWSNSIRNSDYNDIISFLKKNAPHIRDNYPEIIENTYANNVGHVKNILNFIRDTPFIEDECVCLGALFEQMKKNGELNSYEIFMVAYRLKQIMEMNNYPNINGYFKNIADGLKNSFQISVKNLIWNGVKCTIKNKDRNEYLYAPNNDWTYDSERRRVFTWREGDPVIQGYWNISPENNGDYFTIKNTIHNEYLYAASDEFAEDKDRRNIFMWRVGTAVIQGDWTLIPADDGNYFAIKNKVHGEYLYAPDNDWAWDKERRRVFTWRGNSNGINEDMKWKIDC